jgi:hypothetical protein
MSPQHGAWHNTGQVIRQELPSCDIITHPVTNDGIDNPYSHPCNDQDCSGGPEPVLFLFVVCLHLLKDLSFVLYDRVYLKGFC